MTPRRAPSRPPPGPSRVPAPPPPPRASVRAAGHIMGRMQGIGVGLAAVGKLLLGDEGPSDPAPASAPRLAAHETSAEERARLECPRIRGTHRCCLRAGHDGGCVLEERT